MADNFDKVVKALAENNKAQDETTDAVNKLNQTMADHFTYLKRQEKDQEEDRREAGKARRQAQSAPKSDKGTNNAMKLLGVAGMITALSGIAGTIGTISAFAVSFIAAGEGLGVYAKDLKAFNKGVKAFFTPLKKVTEAMGKLKSGLLKSLGIIDDAVSGPAGGPPGTKKATLAQLARQRWSRFTLTLLNSLGIGPDGKAIQLRQKDYPNLLGKKSPFGLRLEKALSKFDELFSKLRNFGNAIAGYFSSGGGGPAGQGGAQSKGAALLEKLAKFKPLRIVTRLLRPIAILFSVFDGMRNAEKEMADKEGFIEKYLGGAVGGFTAGFLGSFFGEFFNLLKDIPIFLIKQIVPKDWLIENEDGSIKFDTTKNIFTKILGGIETLDFNRLITDVVQKPFNLLAETLQFITDIFGLGGEDKQKAAQARWDEWWNKTTWGQKGLDILKVITNIAFSPITSIISEIETAFMGKDEDEVYGETFVDKLTKFTKWLGEWLDSLIPSKEEIMRSIATQIGPGRIATFLGLDKYFTDEEARAPLEAELERLRKIYQVNLDMDTKYSKELNKDVIKEMQEVAEDLNELREKQGLPPINVFNIDNSTNSVSSAVREQGGIKNLGITPTTSYNLGYDRKYVMMRGVGFVPMGAGG